MKEGKKKKLVKKDTKKYEWVCLVLNQGERKKLDYCAKKYQKTRCEMLTTMLKIYIHNHADKT